MFCLSSVLPCLLLFHLIFYNMMLKCLKNNNVKCRGCYDLKSLGLDKRTNSCIRVNTRELDRELFYKIIYLIYSYRWSMLGTVHPTLNDHVSSIRLTYGVHVV